VDCWWEKSLCSFSFALRLEETFREGDCLYLDGFRYNGREGDGGFYSQLLFFVGGAIMGLRGFVSCSLDGSRLTIPRCFLKAFEGESLLVFPLSAPYPHLRLYTADALDSFISALLREKNPNENLERHRQLFINIYSQCESVSLDSRNRIHIAQKSQDRAELENEVVIIGANDHLLICSQKTYDDYMADNVSLELP
jgi:division/cell wall cluster transcriptional repressor MraZ